MLDPGLKVAHNVLIVEPAEIFDLSQCPLIFFIVA